MGQNVIKDQFNLAANEIKQKKQNGICHELKKGSNFTDLHMTYQLPAYLCNIWI